MEIYSGSLWSKTWTCFPEAQKILISRLPNRQWKVLILGCGDGKHTIPFLKAGHQVVALDTDPVGVYGGEFDYLGQKLVMKGLIENLKSEKISESLIKIELVDYNEFVTDEKFDVVLTSCSWQFRHNYIHPIRDILKKIKSFVSVGGILVADYMQPHEGETQEIEHYISLERMAELFSPKWFFHLHCDEGIKWERHIGAEELHSHHYGSLIVEKKA